MIFAERQRSSPSLHGPEEAESFERYLQGRNRYKEELIESLARTISQGPVLEANGGFGTLGVELLRRKRFELHCLCEAPHGQALCERRLREHGLEARCHPGSRQPESLPFPPASFELVYSVNCLHEWESPVAVLTRLHGLLREGGVLVINDLKRDANPYITEYVLREMAADESSEGRFHLQVFLRSLQSAWSVAEVRQLLEAMDVDVFELETQEAMTLTARLHKGKPCPSSNTAP